MDAFNFSYSGDLSYQLLDSDMSTEYECEKVGSGYRFNIDGDSTVYVKVTNNSDETKKTNFRVDEYNHYYRNITLNGTLNQYNWMEMSDSEVINTLGVACYTFTIPSK